MKFLVDECMSTRVPELLTAAGHDVIHIIDCASVLLANLDVVTDELNSGAFVVISEKRLRLRRLPLP